ncbi:MAG: peptidoglycan-associated lipoprotein Pal [Nitrospirae bacterium]|nr:MAG: peptidoglycan-associated lipoprotein Pal [Nitrospirota bacterium]
MPSQPPSQPGVPPKSPEGQAPVAPSPQQKPTPRQPQPGIEPLKPEEVPSEKFGGSEGVPAQLQHVFFDFDRYTIRPDAVPVLQANARLLKTVYRDATVLIEGHCDERGTEEYNLVLGERRAQAVRQYLVDLGISPSRIQIVSYGEEKPFCREHGEPCWQQNRRGHFVLQKKM